MIKNERQLWVTRTQLEKFTAHLAQIEKLKHEGKSSPLLEIEENAIKSQIKELRNQISTYETLWASRQPIPVLQSFNAIPRALIEARLSLGLNQKEFADLLKLKEQQVQRYEATEYETASLSRIKEIIEVLNLKTSDSMKLPKIEMTYSDFIRKIKDAGFSNDLIYNRLFPTTILSKIKSNGLIQDAEGVQIVEYIGKILHLSPTEIIENRVISLNPESSLNVRFKVRKSAKPQLLNAYTFYAHYLSLIVLQASQHLQIKPIPVDPFEVRADIIQKYQSLTLESAVRYIWGLGVPVIALDDPGAFQGAFFHENGRSIIIIKSKSKSNARWLFDLFHEFWHAAQYTNDFEPKSIIIEDFENHGGAEETVASLFAGAILLGRPSDKLVQMCINESKRDVSNLKQTVQNIAKRENVPVDVLANCVAYKLSEKENWWGTAETLQTSGLSIPETVRDILLDNIDLSKISDFDVDLLRRALDFSSRTKEIYIN